MSHDAAFPPSLRLLSEWLERRPTFFKRDETRRDGLHLLGDVSDPLTLDAIARIEESETLKAEFAGLSNVVFLDRFEEPDAFEESDRILAALGRPKTTAPRLVIKNDLGASSFSTELHPLTLDGGLRLRTLLAEMRRLRTQEPDKLRSQTEEIAVALASTPRPVPRVGEASLRAFERTLKKRLETSSENLERPLEYPSPDEISILLRACATRDDPSARELLTDVLTSLVQGNLFDQIGGGFFERRSGSEPIRHFKRTRTLVRYASSLFEAHQLTKHPALRRSARATLDYVTRRLARPGGGFFAGIDFAKRTRSLAAPGRDAYTRVVGREFGDPFLHFFGLSGSLEADRLPSSWVPLEKTASRFSLSPTVLADRLAEASELVRESFESEPVNLDERVFFEDTALAVEALVMGYRVVADPTWLDLALDSYEFLREARESGALRSHQGFFREERFGTGHRSALVATLKAAISLYEVTGSPRFLEEISVFDELLEEATPPLASELEVRLHAARIQGDQSRVAASELRISQYFETPPRGEFQVTAALALGRALHPRLHLELELAEEGSEEASRVVGTTYLPFRDEVWRVAQTTSLAVERAGERISLPLDDGLRGALVGLVRSLAPRPILLDRRLEGRAVAARTSNFLDRKRLGNAARARLGEIEVSRLAIGTHRTGLDHGEHEAALCEAIRGGINVIDTAPSFSFGDSERVLGNVLAQLIDGGEVAREEIVLLDKIGTFVGPDRRLASKSPRARLFPFRPTGNLDVGFSSLDPTLLAAQLESERQRLGVTTIDVVFLVLPLQALSALSPEDRASLVRGAVDLLRRERDHGSIGAAGVTAPSTEELGEILALLDSTGFDPELFRAASLPVNLVEDGAVRGSDALSTKLRERGLTLFAYRPLTDLSAGCVRRLVPVRKTETASPEKLRSAEYRVRSLESELETRFLPRLDLSNAERARLRLPLGSLLGPKLLESNSLEQMEQAETTLVSPTLGRALRVLAQRLAPIAPSEWPPFYENYLEAAGAYLAEIQASVALKNIAFLDEIAAKHGKLAADFPGFALEWLLEPERVDVAVVGIRRVERARALTTLLLALDRKDASRS